MKKTIYHSSLTTPTRLSVESDVMVSKFAEKKGTKQNEPGYYYMFVKVDGVDHSLNLENPVVAKTLAAYKGKGEITVQAEGRDETATIAILNSDGTHAAAPTPAPASSPADGLGSFQDRLGQNLMALREIRAALQKEQDTEKFSDGLKESLVSTIFINLSPSRRDTDYIAGLPLF